MKYLQSFEANKYEPKIGDVVIYNDQRWDVDLSQWVKEKRIGQIYERRIAKRAYNWILIDINPYAHYKNEIWIPKSSILRIATQKDIDKYLMEKDAEKYNLQILFSFELEDYKKYKNKVDRITRSNKRLLIENWNGLDYYDSEIIKNNFNLHYNDVNYPTIDHKFSIIYGFKNGFSTEFVGSVENLCFTKRKLNSEKGKNIEQYFKDKLRK